MYSYNFLLDCNIPLQRSSEDKKSNGFGSKLIDMCKKCSLYIANGRLFDDTIGKTTCKNVSLIDYLIISPDLFNYITNFNVLDFDPMISDVHNRIHFTLSFQTLKQVNPKNINDLDHTKIKWNPVHANQFQQVLSNRLGEIDSALDDLDSNQNITTEQVNIVVNDLGNVLTQTASSVLGNSNIRSYKSSNSNKPWFDRACRGKRDAFHQVKAKFKHDKSDNVRLLLNERSREFKKQMSNSFNKYKDKCANELRNFSKSDSKQFWKLLNKFSNSKKDSPDISIETFSEYFKNLNSDNSEDEMQDDMKPGDITIDIDAVIQENPIYDEILNGIITQTEVAEAIKKLKNSKAPGIDSILNEYLKNTPPEFISMYCKLFNIVLDTGIIPDSWLLGIIKPVFKNKGNPQDPDNFRAITLISCLDDTVIFADNYDEMQNALKVFENYCKMWKLSVNIGKTKVMVFSKRKSKMDFDFILDGTSLEIVDSYTYLGLLLNYNGSFVCAKKKLVEQSQKALFAVYTKIRNLHLPIDLQLKLFDYLVEPILLYGSEIWGFEKH
ncbi:uncharacterized protein [Mytilus edulis]|uniref:uncharacterized protein n=1 Tax=Mytilus edulis TaxID=6550 RepID=UPI0039F0E776